MRFAVFYGVNATECRLRRCRFTLCDRFCCFYVSFDFVTLPVCVLKNNFESCRDFYGFKLRKRKIQIKSVCNKKKSSIFFSVAFY